MVYYRTPQRKAERKTKPFDCGVVMSGPCSPLKKSALTAKTRRLGISRAAAIKYASAMSVSSETKSISSRLIELKK